MRDYIPYISVFTCPIHYSYAEVRNDVNTSLNLTEDSRVAADKSDSGATMDSHTSTSDTCMSASISPASSIDGEHFPKKHKKTKTSLDGFHNSKIIIHSIAENILRFITFTSAFQNTSTEQKTCAQFHRAA